MNNNDKKDKELLHIWGEAGNTIQQQQQLNKVKMETLLNNTSHDLLSGIRKLLKADALFKALLILGFLTISLLNLSNLFVMATTLICLGIITWSISSERKLIEKIEDLKQTNTDINNSLKSQLKFYKVNIYRYPFMLALSAAMFYIIGSLFYHQIKYETISPVKDITDGVVLLSFLLLGIVISFIANFPIFKARISLIQHLLKDIEEPELIESHLKENEQKKQRLLLITAILIVIGIIVFVTLFILFIGTPAFQDAGAQNSILNYNLDISLMDFTFFIILLA